MANLRTTTDLKNEVLRKAGEPTDGTSAFATRAVAYLNEVYQGLVSGGNEFGIDIDEPWVWAKSSKPIILTLEPALSTGTVTLTLGSTNGTFSSAPTDSQEGRYLKIEARDEYFRIRSHSAGGTAFEIDQPYTEASGTFNYKSIKLDYTLTDDYIIVDDTNDKINFSENTTTELTATLTQGVYSVSDYATEVKTQLDTAGAETYTVTFDSLTRKFTLLQGGSSTFDLFFATGTNVARSASGTLGFDVVNSTGAKSYSSIYPLNGIQRLVRPMTTYRDQDVNVFFFEGLEGFFRRRIGGIGTGDGFGKIYGVGNNTMLRDYPLTQLPEGVPDRFAEIGYDENGLITVRFNRYPKEKTRVEIDYIPIIRDLQDNVASVPLVPKSFRPYLVFAASYYLLIDKSDNKAATFFSLAQAKLKALVNATRERTSITGNNYGRIIPRRDML